MADEASERLSRGQQNGHLATDLQEHCACAAAVLPCCHYPGRNLQMHLAINDTELAPWSNPLAGLVVSSDVSSSADWRAVLDAKSTDSALVVGDARAALAAVPDETFQTTITSPPYWSLRDYGIDGQIGMEESLDDYIANLVDVFDEVRRVTRRDGTLWLNIGDSYTSGGRTWRAPDRKNPVRAMDRRPATPDGLKSKDLIGVPWRIAFALQEAGWYLRADVIWSKPNCQPESVKDRPTRAHEYMFLFSKNERYKYDSDAVRGPNARNLRTIWDVNTQPYKEAHFATYPVQLVEPCVHLATAAGDLVLDPFIGSGTTGVAALGTGRRFVGVELNPSYVNIAERRVSDFIGL
jgi:site-specific DNA-methyltransferase (cytosine-N4-specific)